MHPSSQDEHPSAQGSAAMNTAGGWAVPPSSMPSSLPWLLNKRLEQQFGSPGRAKSTDTELPSRRRQVHGHSYSHGQAKGGIGQEEQEPARPRVK